MTTVFEQANADGRALAARHDWSGAEQAFRRATIGAEQLNDDAAAAVALGNLGRALFRLGELARAEAALRRSIGHRETLASRGEHAGLAQALNDLAVVLTATGPTDLAGEPAALFERAMEHAAHAGDGPHERVSINAARAHLAARDAATAEPIIERLAGRAAARDDAAEWDAALRHARTQAREGSDTATPVEASAETEALVFLAIEPEAESDVGPDVVALDDAPSLEFLSLDPSADDATTPPSHDDRGPVLETMELASLVEEPEAAASTLHFVSLLDEPESMDAITTVHDEPPALDGEPTEHEAAAIADAHELAPTTEAVELEPVAPAELAPMPDALDGLVSFDSALDPSRATDDEPADPADDDASIESARAEERAEPRRKGKKRRGRDTRPRSSPGIGGARITPPTAERGLPAIAPPSTLDAHVAPNARTEPSATPSEYGSELEWVEAGTSEIVPRVRQTTGDFAALFDTPEYAELGRSVGRFVQQADTPAHDPVGADVKATVAWEPPVQLAQQSQEASEPAAHEPDAAADAMAEEIVATQVAAAAHAEAAAMDELELPMPAALESEPASGESSSVGPSGSEQTSAPVARPERPSRERSLTPPTTMTAPTRRSWWRRLTSFGREG